MKQGASVNLQGSNGQTPLHAAAARGHLPVLRELLRQSDLRLDIRDDAEQTPLVCAVRANQMEAARILLDAWASFEVRDSSGQLPIHYAAELGSEGAVQLLAVKGASVNARNSAGLSPLHLAAVAGNFATVNVLLAFGANVLLKNISGLTPDELTSDSSISELIRAKQKEIFDERVASLPQPLPVGAERPKVEEIEEYVQEIGKLGWAPESSLPPPPNFKGSSIVNLSVEEPSKLSDHRHSVYSEHISPKNLLSLSSSVPK
eukprot:TRINITY_DN6012_c0_g1_i2.p1 TRINITY_DN6012_c0_g1~~TRINITY_DN6012_c0_g1_i2.p1  ORF type:complete len:261 (+),score=69.60 TRINITY_DN6012_c0_g1_i2:311-1093(+)